MHRWQLESGWQVLMVLLAFSLAGSGVVFLRKALFDSLGFDAQTNWAIKASTYVLFVFPAYQVLLFCIGTLLGQYRFFKAKQLAMLNRMSRPFRKSTL